jgi:hypothetical protein
MVPLDEIRLSEEERCTVMAETTAFVEGQLEALPRRLAIMFALGTTFFRFYVRITRFRAFCDLPPQLRREVVESWAYGSIPLFRALFKVIRSTALLCFFESPPVQAALDRLSGQAEAGEPTAS